MSHLDLIKVKNFTIYLPYITVQFPGETDISNINLAEDLEYDDKNVDIYPNENTKPPIG